MVPKAVYDPSPILKIGGKRQPKAAASMPRDFPVVGHEHMSAIAGLSRQGGELLLDEA